MGHLKRPKWSGAFELWRAARGRHRAPASRLRQGDANVRAALLLRDNLRNRVAIERAYLRAIGRARERDHHRQCLLRARRAHAARAGHAPRRGVQVNLLLQGRYEYFMQYYASRPVFGALLRAGVQIHEYAPSFLHAKVAVIDGRWATVGSSNLDPAEPAAGARSQRGGGRCALRAGCASACCTRCCTRARRMDPATHERRPPWQRAYRGGWRWS